MHDERERERERERAGKSESSESREDQNIHFKFFPLFLKIKSQFYSTA